jgi:GrpB-like predicted nucleotidyltransferase (UPF0157 family)/aminoglycoside phosphotransferase (APT) family kinase protein
MFKADWEKTSVTYQLPEGMVEKMVRLAYPDETLISSELIDGGCANLNIKIQLENKKQPLIVRIYLRDKDAADREQKLATLLKETVPAPLTHYVGELEGYRFAMTEYIPGLSLRELLLGDEPHDLSAIMSDVGMMLSKITACEFPKSGFLNKELEVVEHESSDIINFAQGCLNDKTVLSVLSPEVISGIQKAIEHNASLFPNSDEKCLVHGDFDPANILVDKMNGSWVVTGILDWECAFSGSYLWDVANMLRCAHKMPPEFQNSFIDALQKNGIKLPASWRTTSHLLNLSSLLDLLKRSDPQRHPNRCAGIRELINHILSELNNMQKIDRIEIKPYDPNWPHIFEKEAALMRQALGDNCIAIHHVGSTAVPGLAAKPTIDMIVVVKDPLAARDQLGDIGIQYRGEINIPLRSFLRKRGDIDLNIHVYEEAHPEIELNLCFRDYLRNHPNKRDDYARLKDGLVQDESSFVKENSAFTNYTLRKGDFIREALRAAGFNRIRMLKCTHHSEWAAAKHFRDTYFFGPHGIEDPYTWTFTHEEHEHLVLYQGTEIVAYAHIQFWPDKRAAIRMIATDESKRHQSFGSVFLALIEKWLQRLGIKSIHAESRQIMVGRHGYRLAMTENGLATTEERSSLRT